MIDLKFIAVREFSYDHIIGKSGNYMCPRSLYFIVIYHVTWNLIIQKSCLHVEGRNDNSKKKEKSEVYPFKKDNGLLWIDLQDDGERKINYI